MTAGSIVMLIFGVVVLYGGLAWSVGRANKGKQE